MRLATTLTILLAMTAAAQQPDVNPAPRFNVLFNERYFKQATPQETLASIVKAGELGQFDYIASYLMTESEADALIRIRAKEAEARAESDLRSLRAKEKADPFKPRAENALPIDPAEFEKRVQSEATWRGYYQLVKDIRERFEEDQSHIRELQRFLRDGEVTVADATAKIAIRKDPGKALYFKLVGKRWFLEDRTQELPAQPKP